jgi:hypothetical protein
MKFYELTAIHQRLNQLTKVAGVMGMAGKAITAPVAMAGKGLWGASKRAGGPFAPLLFGGTVLGGAAIAGKSISQAKNYSQGFNPQLQEAMVRG